VLSSRHPHTGGSDFACPLELANIRRPPPGRQQASALGLEGFIPDERRLSRPAVLKRRIDRSAEGAVAVPGFDAEWVPGAGCRPVRKISCTAADDEKTLSSVNAP